MVVESVRCGVHRLGHRFALRRYGPHVAQRRQRIVGAEQGHLVDDDYEWRSGMGTKCERLDVFADAGFLSRRCVAGRLPLDHGALRQGRTGWSEDRHNRSEEQPRSHALVIGVGSPIVRR